MAGLNAASSASSEKRGGSKLSPAGTHACISILQAGVSSLHSAWFVLIQGSVLSKLGTKPLELFVHQTAKLFFVQGLCGTLSKQLGRIVPAEFWAAGPLDILNGDGL